MEWLVYLVVYIATRWWYARVYLILQTNQVYTGRDYPSTCRCGVISYLPIVIIYTEVALRFSLFESKQYIVYYSWIIYKPKMINNTWMSDGKLVEVAQRNLFLEHIIYWFYVRWSFITDVIWFYYSPAILINVCLTDSGTWLMNT